MRSNQKWLPILPVGVALLLLSAVAAYPYLVGDGVPRTNDLVPHLHRALALKEMVDLGHLWPRWAATLVHGYGYPVFNFFPILSHWVIVLWHFAGLPLLTAYKFTVWTHALLTAALSYGLGRALTGRDLGGWVTALIYTLSPYLLYDSIVRGSPPESQALACLPLLIWGVWRLNQRESDHLKWILITAAAYAVMILSHHPVTLQVSFMIGGWVAINAFLKTRDERPETRGKKVGGRSTKYEVRNTKDGHWGVVLRPLGALLLGGLLSAFFALPALLEIDATRATLAISQGYTYQDNFLPLSELFRWPLLPADPARLNPPVVRPLPLMGLLTVVAALPFAWPHLDGVRRRLVSGLGITGLLGIWLITPSAAVAWHFIPLLEFTLYPWRLLGWISLVVAVVAGICVSSVVERFNRLLVYWFIGLLVTLMVGVEAIPWLFPPREPLPAVVTRATVAEGEIPPFLIGTTTLGEFLPVAVETVPDTKLLKEQFLTKAQPDRLLAVDGVHWDRLTIDPINGHYAMTAAQPTTLTYRQFYFPGWQVRVDGQPVPIVATPTHGLISFDLPAGNHDVRIWFGDTPIRTIGNVITLLAVGVWVVGIGYWGFRLQTTDFRLQSSDFRRLNLLSVVCSLFLLGLIATISVVDSPLRRPTLLANGVWGERSIEPLDFAGELRMLSYDVSDEVVAAAEPVTLTTFWAPQRKIGVDYAFGVQVVDDDGLPWHAEVRRPADWRFVAGASVWPLDSYRLEPFEITLLDGTPPGQYHFLIGLVRKDTGQTVAAREFGTLTVARAASGDRPLEPGMIPVNETSVGATLVGLKPDRQNARPGDPVRLGILWQRQDDRLVPFELELIDENGHGVWQDDPRQVAVGAAGDRLREDRVLRIPAGLAGGAYRWRIRWGGNAVVTVGQLLIEAPERDFDQPTVTQILAVQFGELAILTGWTPCQLDGPACEIDLVWQAAAETTISYRVFVHLVDENGLIFAQSDGEPAAWTRPTTGWLPPENIVDHHTLTLPEQLPPGPLFVRVGLYNPTTGERVEREGGEGFVEVELEVESD